MSSRFIRGPEVRSNTLVHTAAGNVTLTNESLVVVRKTSGAATSVTLPPSPQTGQRVTVKDGKGDAEANRITVLPDGNDATTIDGAASYVIGENGKVVAFDFDGSEWGVAYAGTSPAGAGTAADADGLTVCEMGDGAVHRTVLIFDAYSLTTTDNGTAGAAGGAKVYDFPQGHIGILGVSQAWSLVTVDGTGLTNVAALEVGLGTTVATSAMASLTGTAEDLVTGKAFTLSSSLSATHQFGSSVSLANVDGSVTAKDAYLNVACSVATSDADGTIVLTGTVTIEWFSVGKKTS